MTGLRVAWKMIHTGGKGETIEKQKVSTESTDYSGDGYGISRRSWRVCSGRLPER